MYKEKKTTVWYEVEKNFFFPSTIGVERNATTDTKKYRLWSRGREGAPEKKI